MPTESAVNLLTASYMAEVEWRGKTYVDDTDTRNHIASLAKSLTEGDRYGVMMCGKYGNGKTTLLYALQRALNFLRDTQGMSNVPTRKGSIRIVDAYDLARMARKDDDTLTALANEPLLAIEDMGKESAEVSSYGNVIAPVADLIEKRYDKMLYTVVTTNLAPKAFGEKYGGRIADRFREMMEVIAFDQQSYRV